MTLSPLHVLRQALTACALCIGIAHAAPLSFDFSGAVTDDPFGVSHLGAPIAGSFSFDPAALDLIPDATTGGYLSQGGDFGFTVTVDGAPFSVAGSLFIGVVNAGTDQYTVTADNGSTTLELLFDDASGTAFTSDALPTSVSLAAFAFRQFRLFDNGAEFLGSVDTLTAGATPPVPEPTSTALLGAGLLLMALLAFGRRMRRSWGVAAAMLFALPAFAIDGVTLIDQNKALAGNVTPDDGPGFPVTISQPGSYRLSSNLTVPSGDTSAIQIAADNVTLDLNGFAILGPVDCTRGCNSSAVGVGVQTLPPSAQNPHFNITVRNGAIQGMGSQGIELVGDSNLVEHVAARGNGGTGISLIDSGDATRGGASTVRHSTALRNGGLGISVTRGVASFNTSSLNAKTGIFVRGGSALYNFISDNSGGLVMELGNYIGNHMTANSGAAVTGGFNQGQNMCNNNPCPGAVF